MRGEGPRIEGVNQQNLNANGKLQKWAEWSGDGCVDLEARIRDLRALVTFEEAYEMIRPPLQMVH